MCVQSFLSKKTNTVKPQMFFCISIQKPFKTVFEHFGSKTGQKHTAFYDLAAKTVESERLFIILIRKHFKK